MARIPVKRDERVVRFFGKRRRLDDNGEFKAGRLRVLVLPETARGVLWHADLSGYNDAVTIAAGVKNGPLQNDLIRCIERHRVSVNSRKSRPARSLSLRRRAGYRGCILTLPDPVSM